MNARKGHKSQVASKHNERKRKMVATKKKTNKVVATPIGRITKETATPIGKVNGTATSVAKAKYASALGAKRKPSSMSSKNLNDVRSMQSSINKLKNEFGGTTTSVGGGVGKKQNLAKSYADHRNKKKIGRSF